MNWRLQIGLAGALALIGLLILFNPVTIVTAATGIIPWLLIVGGVIQFLSVLVRRRRFFRVVIVPTIIGALLVYAGLSMKFGDVRTVGPVSLAFILALLFLGSGAAKLWLTARLRRSNYVNVIFGSGLVSMLIGLIVLGNWSGISGALIGVLLGIEVIADAAAMAVLALRDRDGEEAMEALGLDPVAEAIKSQAAAAAAAAMPVAPAAPPAPEAPTPKLP